MAHKLKNLVSVRKRRVRFKVKNHSGDKCRLTVFRSGMHLYAQVIDDNKGCTLATVSTLEKEIFTHSGNKSNIFFAKEIGKLIAQRSKERGVEKVVFDRGSYLYHGCVKAIAESARENGLKF